MNSLAGMDDCLAARMTRFAKNRDGWMNGWMNGKGRNKDRMVVCPIGIPCQEYRECRLPEKSMCFQEIEK